ncbi:MAG: thioredoxin family protein [Bacteroidales bacterium]|nr:thioredoxin family protein [Bacteroidales bacterium]
MKKLIVLAIAAMLAIPTFAQQKKGANKKSTQTTTMTDPKEDGALEKVYNEEIDPMMQIDEALEEARATGRLVICQVGGNWCPWCLRFANFITTNNDIAEFVRENFVYIHLNTSKEHKNYEMLKRLGNPGRFGYPVLVVLNNEGEVIHIQNSSYLELDKSYDHKKVLEFFQNWTIKAIEDVR